MRYSFLFGPVQSRRLGVSLGIDMVQSKICTLDCVYCECGATAALTLERKEYAPAAAIIRELESYLGDKPKIDYLTFGGSGEPTLNTALGPVVAFLKKSFPEYPCALLTNGTLFYLPEVRREVLPFDMVLPNLDAVSDAAFAKLNRPDRGLDTTRIIDGLIDFRKEFTGTIWLEVFIVPGINDTVEELKLLKEAAQKINPDRVQLNSLDRPGACDWVTPATVDQLLAIARAFAPLPVEIISRQPLPPASEQTISAGQEAIKSLIARRPSTIEEIASHCNLTINEANAVLARLVASGSVAVEMVGKRTFYRPLQKRQ
jgi:wyosine [tRNA(Phe)-imidazoG37] synthetase (radical SAM superfamily)